MTMQRKIILSDRVDLDRCLSALSRTVVLRDRRVSMLDMASRRIADQFPNHSGWYCLEVKNNCEFAVEKALLDAGIHALAPSFARGRTVVRGRVRDDIRLPVLCGYVMVRCYPSPAAFVALRHFDRVFGILGGCISPYRIPDEFVNRYKDLAYAGAYNARLGKVMFKSDTKVRVKDGPFGSFCGIVSADMKRGETRVSVELDIFGRSTPIELDVDQIEKI